MHTEGVQSEGRTGKPKVLQVITHLALGGAEEVAISLAESLHEDVDFTFFVVQGGPRSEIGRNFYLRLQACTIPVHTGTMVPMKLGGALVAGLRLNRLIWRLRPDIIHLHTEIPETTYACATLFGLPDPIKLVRTIHNTSLWPAWARIGVWAERRLRGARVGSVSRGGLDGLKRFQDAYRIPRTPEQQSQVIYAGVTRDELSSPGPPTLNGSSMPVRVLFAGRFEYQKGVDLIPEIVERTAQLTARAVELHIAGSGTFERGLRDWIATQPTAWKVTLGPPIPNLAAYLNNGNHDLILMPSRFEGLSLVAVESLMAGLPVIATRIAGLQEVFQGQYSLLAEAGDKAGLAALLALAINDLEGATAEAMAQRPTLFDRFSQQGMGSTYLQLYQRALVDAPT